MANFGILNSSNQAQAMIAAEGSASVGALVRDFERAESKEETAKTQWMEKLVDSGATQDLTSQILKEFMTRVAQAGISLEEIMPKPGIRKEGAKDEFASKTEDGKDEVQLTFTGFSKDKNLPVKRIGSKVADQGLPSKSDQEWEAIKEKLIKEGKSAQEISRLEAEFKTGATRNQLMNLLRDSAIMYYLDSDNKMRQLIRRRGFADLVEKAGKEMAKEAAVQAQAEVKGFVLHELENQLILRTFLQDGDFKECHRLIKVGEKVGLDSVKWTEDVWPQKREDHGLNLLDVPQAATGSVDIKDSDPDARRQREKYEYKEEDEKDIILNRLRACYMQIALRPGSVASLATWFKIRTLKNGLTRLGIYTRDMDDKLQEEAKTLAKMKTMEMLDEALHEQASLFDPAQDGLLANKIKNCLKNLDRLGFSLGDKEFKDLRDQANRNMYELAQKELADAKADKVKSEQVQKLLARLRKETDLGLKEEA